MKRYLSGYGMIITMKFDATDRQMNIAKKMYPRATITKKLSASKIDYKNYMNSFKDLLKPCLSISTHETNVKEEKIPKNNNYSSKMDFYKTKNNNLNVTNENKKMKMKVLAV